MFRAMSEACEASAAAAQWREPVTWTQSPPTSSARSSWSRIPMIESRWYARGGFSVPLMYAKVAPVVPEPGNARSTTVTSAPACASRYASALPIAPAPTITTRASRR